MPNFRNSGRGHPRVVCRRLSTMRDFPSGSVRNLLGSLIFIHRQGLNGVLQSSLSLSLEMMIPSVEIGSMRPYSTPRLPTDDSSMPVRLP